ncbi:MAG: DUF2065 domain-containing protein [Proteobacteria bacterium]|nr:DUF2065 domain-containing protein [Desulfobulbaceae bacterium]MBU4153290.1 DUF2065 domain-containing protein [Pseudomonadota bacterium]
MKFLVSLIGVILVIEGLPYAAFPEPMQKWLKQLTRMPPKLLRVLGFLSIVTGFLLCYLAQRTQLLG